jgi:protoporphyrinogen oxidase
VKPDAKARYAEVFRWQLGMPQYTMGHLDRVDELESLTSALPGSALAGGGYRGVGVRTAWRVERRRLQRYLPTSDSLEEDQVDERRIY